VSILAIGVFIGVYRRRSAAWRPEEILMLIPVYWRLSAFVGG
jgi:hypothetical protein